MGMRMEVPPPFANLQASRGAERRSTAWQEEPGGGWRCAGILGEFLRKVRVFICKDQISITCALWIGRLADEPVFSRVEREERIQMKVKVLSSF